MKIKQYEMPCNLGDKVFTIDSISKFHPEKNKNIYNGFSIREFLAEGFLISEDGVEVAIDGHGGWTPLALYNSCSEFEDSVFYSIEQAMEAIDKLQ
jgi:hypothetical protein